jgi:hypothetical protein
MKFNLRNLTTLFLCFVLCCTQVLADGDSSYRKEGYPVITIVGGTFLILASLYIAHSTRKNTHGDNAAHGGHHAHSPFHSKIFMIVCLIFLYCVGIFLTFGPDVAPGIAGASNNPRAAIIGLQLLLQVALGVYLLYHPTPIITDIYIIFGIFNLLALMGSNYLFNYNFAIWTLAEAPCNQYFGGDDYTRCDNDGYLQFLRIMGHLATLVLLASIINAIANAYERGHHLFMSSQGATGVPATTTTGGGYAAPHGHHQPAYASSQPAYASSVPKDVTTTTTTSGPATSVPVNY